MRLIFVSYSKGDKYEKFVMSSWFAMNLMRIDSTGYPAAKLIFLSTEEISKFSKAATVKKTSIPRQINPSHLPRIILQYKIYLQLIQLRISSSLPSTNIKYIINNSQSMLKRLTRQILLRCSSDKKDNHFGFQSVGTAQKQPLVNQVFHSVANKYDIMNDVMSMGIHRYWKNQFVNQLGNLTPHIYTHKPKQDTIRVLDVAGGTGDIAFRILQKHKRRNVKVTVLDINSSMLEEGQKRAQQIGLTQQHIQFVCANAEELPFEQSTFDAYTISFGLRNVPRTRKALEEARRILKYGGRFLCLEFSKVQNPVFQQIYRQYSFSVIPELGRLITDDRSSYQYLVESIQRFLTQQQLLQLMQQVGMRECSFTNFTDGIVAMHSGYRLQ